MSRTLPRVLIGLLLFVTATFATSSMIISRSQDVISCLTGNNVPFAVNTSSNWGSLVTPYNLRLIYTPAVITLPTTPQEVGYSVICAAEAGLKVQAKSGGHSYASFSSGGEDGSLIVNLQNFNSITVDNTTGIATVGGGVRLGNLALGIYEQGQRALPHGTCPGVGIGGHFTHGGYGYSSRLWGLGLDTIVALDVVLADGSYIHATVTEYPEIFYAMRGAADSFGIVTYFYLQTNPAPSTVINFAASIPAALNDVETVTNAFLQLQETTFDSTYIDGSITFGIYTDNTGAFSLSGWCIECDATTFNQTTFPKLLEGFPAPTAITSKSLGWIDSLVNEANGVSLSLSLEGYNLHDTFYAKSIVSKNETPLTQGELTSFWSYALNEGRNAPSPWFSIINLYGGAGSQINVPSPDSSAYSDRDALWVFQNYGYTANSEPPFSDNIITFIDGLNAAMENAALQDFGVYLNYADPDLTASQVAQLAYGADTYNKLLGIKQQYDPNFTFWNPQAIGVAPAFLNTTTTAIIISTTTTASPTTNATPNALTPSPDGTCGGTTAHTCTGSMYGTCCSQAGWCGSTPEYCGLSCQGSAGPCLTPSPDGRCSWELGYTCLGSAFGECCSSAGWCGNSNAYCSVAAGCFMSGIDNPYLGVCPDP